MVKIFTNEPYIWRLIILEKIVLNIDYIEWVWIRRYPLCNIYSFRRIRREIWYFGYFDYFIYPNFNIKFIIIPTIIFIAIGWYWTYSLVIRMDGLLKGMNLLKFKVRWYFGWYMRPNQNIISLKIQKCR